MASIENGTVILEPGEKEGTIVTEAGSTVTFGQDDDGKMVFKYDGEEAIMFTEKKIKKMMRNFGLEVKKRSERKKPIASKKKKASKQARKRNRK